MEAQELFNLATDIAEGILPQAPGVNEPTRRDILDVAKIIVQCQQREFQENGLEKIEEIVDRFLADRAEPPPPLPVFRASGGSSPDSDLTTGLATQRQHPTETQHALLYSDLYGVAWFCMFDEEEDGEKERQRVVDKGYKFLAFYHISEGDEE